MTTNEAVDVTAAVTQGNASTCGLVLLPQQHSSTDTEIVFKHRRLVEDAVTAILGSIRFGQAATALRVV